MLGHLGFSKPSLLGDHGGLHAPLWAPVSWGCVTQELDHGPSCASISLRGAHQVPTEPPSDATASHASRRLILRTAGNTPVGLPGGRVGRGDGCLPF